MRGEPVPCPILPTPRKGSTMLDKVRAVGAVAWIVLTVVVSVVFLPSTAWSAPPSDTATGDPAIGWTTVAGWTMSSPDGTGWRATFGAPNGVLNETGKGYNLVPIQHPTLPLGVVSKSEVPTATNTVGAYASTVTVYDVWYGTRSGSLGAPPNPSTMTKVGTIWAPPTGGTVANPIANTASTCTSYRHIAASVTDGSLDLSYGWSGSVPKRGWEVTDAGPKAAVGSGAVLTTIAPTALPAPPFPAGSYGLQAWTPDAAVTTLRVQVKGTPACFTGFTLTRDGSGVLTGAVAVGAGGVDGAPDVAPDTSEQDTATDDQGADCGTFDVFCQVKYLFWPHPSEWDFAGVWETAETRPPFSTAVEVFEGLAGVGQVFEAPGNECGNLGFWDLGAGTPGSDDIGNHSDVFDCQDGTTGPVGGLRDLVELGLVAVTMVYLGRQVAGGFKG